MSIEFLMISSFVVFFVASFAHLLKINSLFAVYYFFLFLYTIFSQIGYVYYPEYVMALSSEQYYGPEIFTKYWLFVFLSFVCIYLFAIFVLRAKFTFIPTLTARPMRLTIGGLQVNELLFVGFVLLVELFLLGELHDKYAYLGYRSAELLKGNKLWFYLLYFNSLLIFMLYARVTALSVSFKKHFYVALLCFCAAISLITNIRMGGRITMFFLATAFIGFFVPENISLFSRKFWKGTVFVGVVVTALVVYSQTITAIRGTSETENIDGFISVASNVNVFKRLTIFENLMTQDYFVPSLTIVTSMYYDLVFPLTVLKSNVLGLIPLIPHITLGGVFVQIVNPLRDAGYGYYILTEGYNVMGFLGIFYNMFTFVLGFKILHRMFAEGNDPALNRFMRGVIAFLIISVVRGQSMYFVKALYFVFAPAVVLYMLSSSRALRFRFLGEGV